MKFRPLHARVVIRRIDEVGKTQGGIIIPDTAKEKPVEGEIVAVGWFFLMSHLTANPGFESAPIVSAPK